MIKQNLRRILLMLVFILLHANSLEAMEVNIAMPEKQDAYSMAIDEINHIFERYSYPDSAYIVELEKDVYFEKECGNSNFDYVIWKGKRPEEYAPYKIGSADFFHSKTKEKESCLKITSKIVPNQLFFDELATILSKYQAADGISVRILSKEFRIEKELSKFIKGKMNDLLKPFLIRYELKDKFNTILYTVDTEIELVPKADIFIKDPDLTALYSIYQYDRFNVLASKIIDHINISTTPEGIKQINAYIATQRKSLELEEQEHIEENKRIQQEQVEEKIAMEAKEKKQRKIQQFLPKCKNEILNQMDFFISANMHTDKGKCVDIGLLTFQMTSDKTGLFRSGNGLVFVTFQKPFRGPGVVGIAKIKGIYNYTTVSRVKEQIPSLEMLYIEE